MTIDIEKLKLKIVQNNTTQESLSDKMGMNRSTFYRRIKGKGAKFTVLEIYKIAEILKLTKDEIVEIFLSIK